MSDDRFYFMVFVVFACAMGAVIAGVYGTAVVSTKLCTAQSNQFAGSWGIQSATVSCDGQTSTASAGGLPSSCTVRSGDKLDVQFKRWFGPEIMGDFNC